MYMSKEDELKIYHIFCSISKDCRDYFWLRNHMPNDGWSIDNEVNAILTKLEKLNRVYEELSKKYPKEEEEWDTDQI